MQPTLPCHEISQAKPEDAPELAQLVNSAYRGDSSRAGWTTEADLLGGQRTDPAWIAQEIQSADRAILCLREQPNPAVLGCVLLKRIPATRAGHTSDAYLGMLTIRPTLQDQGLGRVLLESAERHALEAWGAKRVVIHVIDIRQELIAWYGRRGYRLTGRTEPFPYGDERFGLPQRPDLRFVIMEKALSPAP
jgi:ribosomal protein S18 acetylase RimI-like enzyme